MAFVSQSRHDWLRTRFTVCNPKNKPRERKKHATVHEVDRGNHDTNLVNLTQVH